MHYPKSWLFLNILLFSFITTTSQHNPPQPYIIIPPISITNNNQGCSNNNNSSQVSQTYQCHYSHITHSLDISFVSDLYKKGLAVYDEQRNLLKNNFCWLWNNKYKTTLFCLALFISWLRYKKYLADTIIHNKNSWCHCKRDKNLNNSIKSSFIKNLLQEFHKRLLLSKKTNNGPFETFIQQLNKEKNILDEYLFWEKLLQQYSPYPFDNDTELIQEKIDNLLWLFELFALWQVEQLYEN